MRASAREKGVGDVGLMLHACESELREKGAVSGLVLPCSAATVQALCQQRACEHVTKREGLLRSEA